MRALKTAALAGVILLPMSVTAFAADAIMEQPPEPQPAPVEAAPQQIWTGPYAGIFLGHNWTNFEGINADSDGLSGGAYAGYNWQFNNYVFGLEADLGYSDVEESAGGRSAQSELFGSARARAGVAFDPFLVYATGGLAVANAEYSELGDSDSNTHIGYTVGGGVEGLITENVTARLEYRYTDYGSEDYTLNNSTFSGGYDEHSVRAGIGLKF